MNKHEATFSRASMSVPLLGARAGSALTKIVVVLSAALLVAVPGAGFTAQLTLTDSPLFLTTAVPSNIFFLTDDSGSMEWEFAYNDGTGLDNGSVSNSLEKFTDVNIAPDSAAKRLFMCVGYNNARVQSQCHPRPCGRDKTTPATPVPFKNAWLYNGGTDASPNYNVRKNPYVSDSSSVNRTDLAATGVMAYWPWGRRRRRPIRRWRVRHYIRQHHEWQDIRRLDHRPQKRGSRTGTRTTAAAC